MAWNNEDDATLLSLLNKGKKNGGISNKDVSKDTLQAVAAKHWPERKEGTALTRKMPPAEKPQIQINEESIRDDFRETVFFYPQLSNQKMNEIPFSFLLPDALTRWKFRAIAHNEELGFSQVEHELISKKELMMQEKMQLQILPT